MTDKLTKVYRNDSGVCCNYGDMIIAVRAWGSALSVCMKDGICSGLV